MFNTKITSRLALAAILIVGLCLVVGWGLLGGGTPVADRPAGRPDRSRRDSLPEAKTELPPIATGGFTNSNANYVGSQACATCHEDQHATYLQTTHSRALGDIVLDQEPPDVEFAHEPSDRTYKVYRRDGQMWHRESVRPGADAAEGDELVLCDYPMRYTIGSGHHSRSYLVEIDGFLVESPVTWYASRDAWGMSPGYDRPVHAGFERLADYGCLVCHAGRIEGVDGSRYRVAIHEATIGCENCHGPGGDHVALDFDTASTEEIRSSIVNPDGLSREQAESICAQCHLRGDATVTVRGRDMSQYRPGMLLSAVRIDYGLQKPDTLMEVVGHVEQMRQSRCYTESAAMTCTTCHDPHDSPAQPQRVAYFRAKCLECHQSQSCGLAEAQRLERDAEDNCMTCHMPRGDTDIPHFAFTHHRIGLHDAADEPASENRNLGDLVPLYDVSDLPQIERDRGLALAYLEFSEKQSSEYALRNYRARSRQLLKSVRERGLKDPKVDAASARLAWENGDLDWAVTLSKAALVNNPDSTDRANALLVLGDSYLQAGQPDRSVAPLERLANSRRRAEDWLMLAFCYQELEQLDKALAAARKAVEIQPARTDVREVLAELAAATGDRAAAAQQREIVRILDSGGEK